MPRFLKKDTVILAVILLFALFLRLYQVSNLPLYGDELTIALDSYSILKTAHSSTGQFLPLTFEMGAGRPGGYVYASLPFIALFGPSALGVRALSILSGLLIILLIYLLGKILVSRNLGIVAAILMVISPWDLSLSRGGFEAHFALMLALLGTYCFLMASRKNWLLLVSAISFGLTIHTYPTYKLVLPVFLILLIWYKGGRKILLSTGATQVSISAIVLAMFVVLAGSQTLIGGSEQRFENINIFARDDVKQKIIQQVDLDRNLVSLPPIFVSLLHNRPLEYGDLLLSSYISNFSADFMFLKGDENPTHNMAGVGSFYIAEIITILAGFYFFYSRDKKLAIFLTFWLLLSPIASTILLETHALRSAFMLLPLTLVSAGGFSLLWSNKKAGRLLALLIILAVTWEFIFVFENLYFFLPNRYSRFWSGPAKMATEIARENIGNYDLIILSDKIDNVEYAYPVYTSVDPNLVIDQSKNKENLGSFQFKKYGNVYIGSVPRSEMDNLANELNKKILYIGSFTEDGALTNYDILKGKDNFDELTIKKYL